MKNRTVCLIMTAALLLTIAVPAFAADMVVIVNNDNTSSLNKSTIERIYKGELTSWPAGGPVVAYDLPESSDARAEFTRALVGVSVSSLKATWTVKLFSGKATPPKVVSSDSEMKSAVSSNRNAIGYISASSLDSSVKSVLTVK